MGSQQRPSAAHLPSPFPLSLCPQTWLTTGQKPLGELSLQLQRTVGPLVICPRQCSALPIKSGFVLPLHLQSQHPQMFLDLYSGKHLATCMPCQKGLAAGQQYLSKVAWKTLYVIFYGLWDRHLKDISLTQALKKCSAVTTCAEIPKGDHCWGVKFSFPFFFF